MNESDFETELRTLRPLAPSPAAAERIAAELHDLRAVAVATPRTLERTPASGTLPREERSAWASVLRGLLWASAGAAVAVLILLSQPRAEVASAPASAPIASVQEAEEPSAQSGTQEQTESELVAAADEGLRFDQTGTDLQRQMRLTYLERHVWTNPQTGAVIEFEVPREDIVMMPVAMQ